MTDLLTELQCTKPPSSNCYRLIILGSGRVGKTSVVRRFLYDDFSDAYIPTIEDFHRKIYKIHNEVYQLDILDTSAIHPFPAMRRLSFLTGDAFILLYSVDSRDSFDEVLRLREQILESIHSAAGSNKKDKQQNTKTVAPIPMIIAGNKCDKTAGRVVPTAEVQQILQRFKDHVAFIECSSKENVNIVELFETLFILADLPDEMIPNADRRISLTHGGNVLLNGTTSAASPAAGLRDGKMARCWAELRKMLNSKTARHDAATPSTLRHGLILRRRLSDAYSALITNVRRPSIKADLIMVREKREQSSGSTRNKPRNKKRSRKHHELEREKSSDTVVDSDDEQPHSWREKLCCAN